MPLALRLTVDKIIAMLVEGEGVWRRESRGEGGGEFYSGLEKFGD